MLWGEPLAGTADFMARVRKAAGIQSITFSLSTRPILADTEDKAWNRAQDILARVTARTGGVENPNNCVAENVGSQRLLAAAAAGDVHGTCLWTKLAAAGARGNSTALVGTPDTIAKAMVEYYKLGATSLLIRGYDPRPDAIQFGKELIPRVRELVSAYDAGTA
jgi:alkanesulfonate monooxygenase